MCEKAGIDRPSSEEMRLFRERIKVLFTWGARLEDTPNIKEPSRLRRAALSH
jgi:hypothetical protein